MSLSSPWVSTSLQHIFNTSDPHGQELLVLVFKARLQMVSAAALKDLHWCSQDASLGTLC